AGSTSGRGAGPPPARRRWRGSGTCSSHCARGGASRLYTRGGMDCFVAIAPRNDGLFRRLLRFVWMALVASRRASPARERLGEPVEIEIDHRRGEQRQRLADDEAADHGI